MVLVTQITITLLHGRTSETCYSSEFGPWLHEYFLMEFH